MIKRSKESCKCGDKCIPSLESLIKKNKDTSCNKVHTKFNWSYMKAKSEIAIKHNSNAQVAQHIKIESYEKLLNAWEEQKLIRETKGLSKN